MARPPDQRQHSAAVVLTAPGSNGSGPPSRTSSSSSLASLSDDDAQAKATRSGRSTAATLSCQPGNGVESLVRPPRVGRQLRTPTRTPSNRYSENVESRIPATVEGTPGESNKMMQQSSSVGAGARLGTRRFGQMPGLPLAPKNGNVPFSLTRSPASYTTTPVKHFDLDDSSEMADDDNVQVIVRVRPLNAKEQDSTGAKRCVRQDSPHSLTFLTHPEPQSYTFDHVAGEQVSQEELFRAAGWPMVDNCMAGYNSTLFAYGQTGSGKTHTMLGNVEGLDRHASAERGIIPRVFELLFERIKQEEESRKHEQLCFTCTCSFLEIYNEQITDLLDPMQTNLQIREDPKKGHHVEDLTSVVVDNVQGVVNVLLQGAANRKVAATNMNQESSRSHSVFTGTVECTWTADQVTNTRFGRLHLVDLAGSERQKSSGATGDRLREASSINKSLTHLGHVIMVLVEMGKEKKERHIPYRDSKLTFLLQDSLGGNSKTTMIANISPSWRSFSETISTLKFAQRAKFMKNKAVVNEDTSGDVEALKEQIRKLKEELWRSRSKQMTPSPMRGSLIAGGLSLTPVRDIRSRQSMSESRDGLRLPGSPMLYSKKMKAMEAILAGCLRREQQADHNVKHLTAEMEQLNRLLHLREKDLQNQRMVLRFREEKIRGLDAVCKGRSTADEQLQQEVLSLREEVEALNEKLERNPEVTKFAMENIRLSEQLHKLQDFYDAGEREAIAAELGEMREQVLDLLEVKARHDQNKKIGGEGEDSELEVLRIEADTYLKELTDARKNLTSCLESNAKMAREVEEQQNEIRKLRSDRGAMEAEISTLKAANSAGNESNQSSEVAELVAHIQQRQSKAEEDALSIERLEAALKAAEAECSNLKKQLEEAKEADRSQELEESLREMEESLTVAQAAATAAESAKQRLEEELGNKLKAQEQAAAEIEESRKSKEQAAVVREEILKKDLQEANALLEELPLAPGAACLPLEQSASLEVQPRSLAADLAAVSEQATPGKEASDARNSPALRSGHHLSEDYLRSRAEERVRRRRAELSSAQKAAQEESTLRKKAEERAEHLEKELEELLARLAEGTSLLEAKNGEMNELKTKVEEFEAEFDRFKKKLEEYDNRDAAMAEEIEQLREEVKRERDLSTEAGVTAEEEWKRRQEVEMAKAAVERELLTAKREAEELRRLQQRTSSPAPRVALQFTDAYSSQKHDDSDGELLNFSNEGVRLRRRSSKGSDCRLSQALEDKTNRLVQDQEESVGRRDEEEQGVVRRLEKELEEARTIASEFQGKQKLLEMLWEKERKMQAELENESNRVRTLEAEVHDLRAQLAIAEDVSRELEETVMNANSLMAELEERRSEVDVLRQSNMVMKADVDEKQRVIEALESEMLAAHGAAELASSAHGRISDEKVVQETESLKDEVAKLQRDLEKTTLLAKEHEALAVEATQAQAKEYAAQMKTEGVMEQLGQKQEQLKKLSNLLDERDSELLRVDQQLQEAERHREALQEEVIKQQVALKDLQQKMLQDVSNSAAKDSFPEHRQQIDHLEALAAKRQKEIFTLNVRLAEAESINHDVLRELLGMKGKPASNVRDEAIPPSRDVVEHARRRSLEFRQTEQEVSLLRQQKEELIQEREGWLEEINRRQAEMVAARYAAEKLHLRDTKLASENERLQNEATMLRQKLGQLEAEVRKLSGQQNLQQRIHHHAKIKEENNALREQNEDLTAKLKRIEVNLARVSEELGRYRTAEGKAPAINLDEEERLQIKLKELDENRMQLAENLLQLCNGIVQAAGEETARSPANPAQALDAVRRLQARVNSVECELADCKLKARIASEKQRLNELRAMQSPQTLSSLVSTQSSPAQ